MAPAAPRVKLPSIPPLAAHAEYIRLAKLQADLANAWTERANDLERLAIEGDLKCFDLNLASKTFQQGDRATALRARHETLSKALPAKQAEPASADGMPADIACAFPLLVGERVAAPEDRDAKPKRLHAEKAMIERAQAKLAPLIEEIRDKQSLAIAELLAPEYRKLQRHIFELALALSEAVAAEREFTAAPVLAGYADRCDVLGRRRLDAAARLGTLDSWDSQISGFRRELQSLGVL